MDRMKEKKSWYLNSAVKMCMNEERLLEKERIEKKVLGKKALGKY